MAWCLRPGDDSTQTQEVSGRVSTLGALLLGHRRDSEPWASEGGWDLSYNSGLGR